MFVVPEVHVDGKMVCVAVGNVFMNNDHLFIEDDQRTPRGRFMTVRTTIRFAQSSYFQDQGQAASSPSLAIHAKVSLL